MNLENIGRDCPCYEVDCSDIMFDIGEFCGLPPNNGKLTIQVNGSTVGDFSANQQEDETINITTPTSQDIADAVDGEARLREQADNTLQSNINAEELARQRADRDIQAVLDGESLARVNEDRNLQSQIDAIASKSDVVDVVGTYAELQAYDTSKLNDNDVVKVLDDSTHNDAMTYYRWNKTTQTWSYIGQESPYYSKSQTDNLLAQKQDNLTAGTGITLNGSTISADTTVLAEKSELSNYAEKANTYTKTEVDNLVEPKLSVDVVEQLPVQGEESKLYLTPKAHTTQTATGNPITATITDGAGQIEDFQLDGDTYQQSYSGKNLFNGETVNAWLKPDGSENSSQNDRTSADYIVVQPNATYTLHGTLSTNLKFTQFDSSRTVISQQTTTSATRLTVTTEATTAFIRIGWGNATNASDVMLEIGSTATDYEPYVGGIASPNPTYPQPIQVVTGTQTIAINGTNYPLDLGNIELCKLGTYQDYIYKDGDTWKVHKEVARNTGSLEVVGISSTLNSGPNVASYTGAFAMFNVNLVGLSTARMSENIGIYQSQTLAGNADANAMVDGTFCQRSTNDRVYFRNTGFIGKTGAEVRQMMITNSGGIKITYFLTTPTDTAITDATLISQLNAIASASLENGSNTITNTATGSNLAGDMEVDYFGYDPTNRYDKWLWLDINNAYEKLGS